MAGDPNAGYRIEMDLRGETLVYHEPGAGRRAAVICTFGRDPCLSPRTLEDWWYPAERRAQAMTGAEREAVLARIITHARTRLGLSALRVEGA